MKSGTNHWQSVYQTKDYRRVGWYQDSPETSLDLLNKIDASKDSRIIDAGCGASLLVDHLLILGFQHITLTDLSSEALSITKERLKSKGNIPVYNVGDITQSSFSQPFDIWHDRAVFHFLTDHESQQAYMKTLVNSLVQKGTAIIGTFSVNGPDRCSGLPVVRYDDQKMNKVLPSELLLTESVIRNHFTPGGIKQEYCYFIIKKKTDV